MASLPRGVRQTINQRDRDRDHNVAAIAPSPGTHKPHTPRSQPASLPQSHLPDSTSSLDKLRYISLHSLRSPNLQFHCPAPSTHPHPRLHLYRRLKGQHCPCLINSSFLFHPLHATFVDLRSYTCLLESLVPRPDSQPSLSTASILRYSPQILIQTLHPRCLPKLLARPENARPLPSPNPVLHRPIPSGLPKPLHVERPRDRRRPEHLSQPQLPLLARLDPTKRLIPINRQCLVMDTTKKKLPAANT